MASGLNQPQLRFMVGEVQSILDSLSAEALGLVNRRVLPFCSGSYFDLTNKSAEK